MYHKSIYTPKHPEKYAGDYNNIICRSSWERIFCIWCDTNSAIVEWSSEETIIPYISPLDGRRHRYFVDNKIVVLDASGLYKTYLIEIKPYAQTIPPNEPKRKTARFQKEIATWYINCAKWAAAEEYCMARGWTFRKLTEYDLGIKSYPKATK